MKHLFLILSLLASSLASSDPPSKRVRLTPLDEVQIQDHHNYTLVERKFGPAFAQYLQRRMQNDGTVSFYPDPENNATQSTPMGELELGEILARSQESVVYTVVGRDDILIKYQANCFEAMEENGPNVHPLLVETWFGRKAGARRIGPMIHFVSPPSRLCEINAGKCAFDMDEEDFGECKANPRAFLRYMIVQRVYGQTLYDFKNQFPDGIVPFPDAIKIGHTLIQFLDALHNLSGVVHGDIHLGNIMISSTNGTVGSMKLIDFGRSFENVTQPEGRIREPGWSLHSTLTAWEMDGFAYARRDDVARAIYVIAELIQPANFTAAERSMEFCGIFFGPEQMIEYKANTNFFGLAFTPTANGTLVDPVDALHIPTENKTRIKGLLARILDLVRAMAQVNSTPPYEEIRNCFSDIYVEYSRGLRSRVVATTTSVPFEH